MKQKNKLYFCAESMVRQTNGRTELDICGNAISYSRTDDIDHPYIIISLITMHPAVSCEKTNARQKNDDDDG